MHGTVIPISTHEAAAFGGKKGSKYTVHWYKELHYGPGDGGYSNAARCDLDDDIDAYLRFAEQQGYEHIILAGHSLGANKVIYYLSKHHDKRVEKFFLLSPANLTHMMSGVNDYEKRIIREQVKRGDGNKMLPFPYMGWVDCIANTAYDWQFSELLNNVHTDKDGDFSQSLHRYRNGGSVDIQYRSIKER